MEAVKREVGARISLASTSSTGGEENSPLPRGMKIIELRDPVPLNNLKEAGKGGAVRYHPVTKLSEMRPVDEEVEEAPAGYRMVELREPVPIGKLV